VGRLVLLFAYYHNWLVSVPDNAIAYAPHERSSYSAMTTAANYYQTRSYFLA
jgi:hypothetical protein